MFTTRKGKTKQKKSVPVVLSGSLSRARPLPRRKDNRKGGSSRASLSDPFVFFQGTLARLVVPRIWPESKKADMDIVSDLVRRKWFFGENDADDDATRAETFRPRISEGRLAAFPSICASPPVNASPYAYFGSACSSNGSRKKFQMLQRRAHLIERRRRHHKASSLAAWAFFSSFCSPLSSTLQKNSSSRPRTSPGPGPRPSPPPPRCHWTRKKSRSTKNSGRAAVPPLSSGDTGCCGRPRSGCSQR